MRQRGVNIEQLLAKKHSERHWCWWNTDATSHTCTNDCANALLTALTHRKKHSFMFFVVHEIKSSNRLTVRTCFKKFQDRQQQKLLLFSSYFILFLISSCFFTIYVICCFCLFFLKKILHIQMYYHFNNNLAFVWFFCDFVWGVCFTVSLDIMKKRK